VPDNDSVAWEFEALLTIDNAPEDEPLARGENVTLNDLLPPAVIVSGNEIPCRAN
jgi:hypothetical protein